MRGLSILVLVAGCPGGGDDGVADSGADASTAGLTLAWSSRPGIPGPAGSNIELARAVLRAHNLRVVGDAGPGDPRTFLEHVTLEWASGITPDDEEFSDAPAGLYSRIVLELDRDDEDYAYELTGMVDINGSQEAFTIRDSTALPISIECEVTLAPGGEATVNVLVDLQAVVNQVDFDALPVEDDRRVLETGDPQMPALRDELSDAFDVP